MQFLFSCEDVCVGAAAGKYAVRPNRVVVPLQWGNIVMRNRNRGGEMLSEQGQKKEKRNDKGEASRMCGDKSFSGLTGIGSAVEGE